MIWPIAPAIKYSRKASRRLTLSLNGSNSPDRRDHVVFREGRPQMKYSEVVYDCWTPRCGNIFDEEAVKKEIHLELLKFLLIVWQEAMLSKKQFGNPSITTIHDLNVSEKDLDICYKMALKIWEREKNKEFFKQEDFHPFCDLTPEVFIGLECLFSRHLSCMLITLPGGRPFEQVRYDKDARALIEARQEAIKIAEGIAQMAQKTKDEARRL